MAAPKGNQFWKNRSEHGRDLLFAKPELLREEICKYFNWSDGHPWHKVEAIKSGSGKLIKVPMSRPYTLSGLCLFLNASEAWWKNFRKNKSLSQDFLSVIEWAEDVIRTQKLEGAALGVFNSNIVARELGMAEKIDARHVDKDGNDVLADKSDEELKQLLLQTLQKSDD